MKTKMFFAFIITLFVYNQGFTQTTQTDRGKAALEKVKKWIEKEILPEESELEYAGKPMKFTSISEIVAWEKNECKRLIVSGTPIDPLLNPVINGRWITIEASAYSDNTVSVYLNINLGEYQIRCSYHDKRESCYITKRNFFKNEFSGTFITPEGTGAGDLKEFPFLFGN